MTTIAPATAAAAAAAATPQTSPERERLHQAAQAFEAIFVRQMLAAARATSFADKPAGGDQAKDTFTAMRDERFADIAAKSGALGMGKQIEQQLMAHLPVSISLAPAAGK